MQWHNQDLGLGRANIPYFFITLPHIRSMLLLFTALSTLLIYAGRGADYGDDDMIYHHAISTSSLSILIIFWLYTLSLSS